MGNFPSFSNASNTSKAFDICASLSLLILLLARNLICFTSSFDNKLEIARSLFRRVKPIKNTYNFNNGVPSHQLTLHKGIYRGKWPLQLLQIIFKSPGKTLAAFWFLNRPFQLVDHMVNFR